MVEELRSNGAPKDWLKRCEDDARDGTQLAGCVKLYIPQPAGQWGAVLTGDEEASKPALVLLTEPITELGVERLDEVCRALSAATSC